MRLTYPQDDETDETAATPAGESGTAQAGIETLARELDPSMNFNQQQQPTQQAGNSHLQQLEREERELHHPSLPPRGQFGHHSAIFEAVASLDLFRLVDDDDEEDDDGGDGDGGAEDGSTAHRRDDELQLDRTLQRAHTRLGADVPPTAYASSSNSSSSSSVRSTATSPIQVVQLSRTTATSTSSRIHRQANQARTTSPSSQPHPRVVGAASTSSPRVSTAATSVVVTARRGGGLTSTSTGSPRTPVNRSRGSSRASSVLQLPSESARRGPVGTALSAATGGILADMSRLQRRLGERAAHGTRLQ